MSINQILLQKSLVINFSEFIFLLNVLAILPLEFLAKLFCLVHKIDKVSLLLKRIVIHAVPQQNTQRTQLFCASDWFTCFHLNLSIISIGSHKRQPKFTLHASAALKMSQWQFRTYIYYSSIGMKNLILLNTAYV